DKVLVAIKGLKKKAIIVGCKGQWVKSHVPRFDTNNCVLVNDDMSPLGNRILVPIPHSKDVDTLWLRPQQHKAARSVRLELLRHVLGGGHEAVYVAPEAGHALGSPHEPQLEDVVVAPALDDLVAGVEATVVVLLVVLEQVLGVHLIAVHQYSLPIFVCVAVLTGEEHRLTRQSMYPLGFTLRKVLVAGTEHCIDIGHSATRTQDGVPSFVANHLPHFPQHHILQQDEHRCGAKLAQAGSKLQAGPNNASASEAAAARLLQACHPSSKLLPGIDTRRVPRCPTHSCAFWDTEGYKKCRLTVDPPSSPSGIKARPTRLLSGDTPYSKISRKTTALDQLAATSAVEMASAVASPTDPLKNVVYLGFQLSPSDTISVFFWMLLGRDMKNEDFLKPSPFQGLFLSLSAVVVDQSWQQAASGTTILLSPTDYLTMMSAVRVTQVGKLVHTWDLFVILHSAPPLRLTCTKVLLLHMLIRNVHQLCVHTRITQGHIYKLWEGSRWFLPSPGHECGRL
ncbi:unnamed protein product, partial [Notodromas monacha]